MSERAYGCGRHGYCVTDGCDECADLLPDSNPSKRPDELERRVRELESALDDAEERVSALYAAAVEARPCPVCGKLVTPTQLCN